VVALLAIARKLGMPRRILVILEGEGLANDATALILYASRWWRSRPACFRCHKKPPAPSSSSSPARLLGAAVGWLVCGRATRARPAGRNHAVADHPYVAY
jgi:CPA1 family monovalent cation:H+ antiporter